MAELFNQSEKSPSLLAQIVDEVEKMSDTDKQSLLMQLRKQKLLQRAREIDASITPSSMTEEEILSICKETRRELYEKRKAGN